MYIKMWGFEVGASRRNTFAGDTHVVLKLTSAEVDL